MEEANRRRVVAKARKRLYNKAYAAKQRAADTKLYLEKRAYIERNRPSNSARKRERALLNSVTIIVPDHWKAVIVVVVLVAAAAAAAAATTAVAKSAAVAAAATTTTTAAAGGAAAARVAVAVATE